MHAKQIPQRDCCHKILEKIRFTPVNYYKSPIFNLQLQNRITETIQLSKPGKFGPLDGFKDGFSFCEN
jgi:hypothetical protein